MKPNKIDKDKNAQIEKLDAEITRSLKVVGIKQAHKRIEDVEKSRKKSAILSVIERIDLALKVNDGMLKGLSECEKNISIEFLNQEIPDFSTLKLDIITNTFNAIRFDFQRNADIKIEDFDQLFPKPQLSFNTIFDLQRSLVYICIQLEDMKVYCQRLV